VCSTLTIPVSVEGTRLILSNESEIAAVAIAVFLFFLKVDLTFGSFLERDKVLLKAGDHATCLLRRNPVKLVMARKKFFQ
jgi:hypothetical protein